MAARSIARVVVSFGMAQIGIKLYLSASAESVSFKQIAPKTKNLTSQKLVDKVTGEEIQRADLLKGYEYAKDQYVTFTDDEVANLQAAKKDTLEIAEFVDCGQIDPLHIEKTYYTGPDKGMDKGYRFLYETLKANNRVAIGTWVARGKEHLVAIRAYQHGLIMQQMFYDTEVRAFDNMCANIAVSPVEMAMGKVLMDTMFKAEFDKSKYRDHFIEKINAALEIKIAGGTITTVATPVTSTGMADSLRASLLAMGVPADKIDGMIASAGVDAPAPAADPLVLTPSVAKQKRTRVKKAS
jgi:DNA end-binding protein Ku